MKHLITLLAIAFAQPALAQLSVDVTGDIQNDLNIAVPALATPQDTPTLAGSTAALGVKVAEVIAADLRGSGLFKPAGPAGLRAVSFDGVRSPDYDHWSGTGVDAP